MARAQDLAMKLVLMALVSLSLAGPLAVRKVRSAKMGQFVGENLLKQRCEEELVTVQLPPGAGVILVDGVAVNVTNLQHRVPLSSGAGLRIDGVVQDPAVLEAIPIYEGSVEGIEDSAVTTLLDAEGYIQHSWIQIGEEVTELIAVDPNLPGVVAEVHLGDYDEEKMAHLQLLMDQTEVEADDDDDDDDTETTMRTGRPFDEDVALRQRAKKDIEIAIGYSQSFCRRFGGVGGANREVARIISATNRIYRRDIGYSVSLVYLDGYCDSNGPYEEMASTSGCVRNGYLQRFRDFWESQRKNIPRDVTHLLHGDAFTDGGTIGCAYTSTLCRPRRAYGVNSIAGLSPLLRTTLVAHELGHNCGADHDNGGGIMFPSDTLAKKFSKFSKRQMTRYLSSVQCVTRREARTCRNSDRRCRRWARQGDCRRRRGVRKACPKSCNAC